MKKYILSLLFISTCFFQIFFSGEVFADAIGDQMNGGFEAIGVDTSATTTNPSGTPPISSDIFTDRITNDSVGSLLSEYQPTGVITASDYTIQGGAKERVIQIINNIITIGALLAIGAIVYAGVLYTIAAGDDEKIKHAKSSLKFGILGFIAMLVSFPLVNAIVNLVYSTAS